MEFPRCSFTIAEKCVGGNVSRSFLAFISTVSGLFCRQRLFTYHSAFLIISRIHLNHNANSPSASCCSKVHCDGIHLVRVYCSVCWQVNWSTSHSDMMILTDLDTMTFFVSSFLIIEPHNFVCCLHFTLYQIIMDFSFSACITSLCNTADCTLVRTLLLKRFLNFAF